MVASLNRENDVYPMVTEGELTIDDAGRVWRTGVRRGNRWTGETRFLPCEPRRAENDTGKYFQVRVMIDRVRYHALAHRLVWRHFHGPIPSLLTVNHRNGDWKDDRPGNLELATYAEQAAHARKTLRRGRLDQWGEKNPSAKLSAEQVREICRRRADGEMLTVIAADFDVAMQTISRIGRGDRRFLG